MGACSVDKNQSGAEVEVDVGEMAGNLNADTAGGNGSLVDRTNHAGMVGVVQGTFSVLFFSCIDRLFSTGVNDVRL